MNTLDDLFDVADRRLASAPEPDADELDRLRRIVGSGPATSRRRARASAPSAERLAALVGDAPTGSGTTTPAPRGDEQGPRWQAPRPARGTLHSRRRTAGDWLSAGVAVLAVAAIIVVGALVVVERATSDEVSQATRSLRHQEAELRNRTTALETSVSLYGSAIADAAAAADAAEPALAALEGRSDETARAAALQALAGFRAALARFEAPASPAPRVRSATPTDLASVAAQLDDVRAAALEVDEAIGSTREARSAVAATEAGLLAALSTFGATLPAWAAAIAEQNPVASDGYRTAVLAAADAVVTAQRRGGGGAAEMTAYGQSVDALRTENQRVLDARVPERRAVGGSVPPRAVTPAAPVEDDPVIEPPADGGADPGTDPGTDPVIPIDPAPTDPAPVEPTP